VVFAVDRVSEGSSVQEREDYSGSKDITLYLERNGKRGLPKKVAESLEN
jgi:hypothetical protein